MKKICCVPLANLTCEKRVHLKRGSRRGSGAGAGAGGGRVRRVPMGIRVEGTEYGRDSTITRVHLSRPYTRTRTSEPLTQPASVAPALRGNAQDAHLLCWEKVCQLPTLAR